MPNENNEQPVITPAPAAAATAEADAPEIPDIENDFSAYLRWQKSGEPAPVSADAPPPAAGAEAPAETAAEPTEPADAPETEDEELAEIPDSPTQPRKKGGYQRKIEKLAREKEELAARLTALEAKLAGNQPATGDAPEAKTPAAADAGKPVPENFDTYEEYVDKLTDWKIEQRETARTATAEASAAQERAAEIGKQWQAKQAEARKDPEMPDFDEVTRADIPITAPMSTLMLESPKGARLAYWLGTHPEETARIAALHPTAAAAELGGILKDLPDVSSKHKPTAVPATRAPRPIAPIAPGGGAAQPAASVYDADTATDYAAWIAARRKQLGKK